VAVTGLDTGRPSPTSRPLYLRRTADFSARLRRNLEPRGGDVGGGACPTVTIGGSMLGL